MSLPTRLATGAVLAAAAATALAPTVAAPSTAPTAVPAAVRAAAPPAVFSPVSTFEVAGEVAEIAAVTPDGRTVVYTDSAAGVAGIVDITNPAAPRQLASVSLPGEPTSVGIVRGGRYAIVSVDTSDGDFANPSGYLAAIDLTTRTVVRRAAIGGQPDSIAVSPDGRWLAVAVENQRDEERVVGGVEGGLPQTPAGFLAVIDTTGPSSTWTPKRVALTGLRGMAYPGDPEPEFVDINSAGIAAVTLQENNAIALVDLATAKVTRSFSAGTVTRTDADLRDDDRVSFTERLTAPREPDAVQWTPAGNLVTADEGDLAAEPSGGRGWTVFSPTGSILFTAGGSAEKLLAAAGYYPDGRSDDKGAEFEGIELATIAGTRYTFVGAERADAVLVYTSEDDAAPRPLQLLKVGDAPEGLLAVPSRGLFLTANEDDGTISIFALSR